MAEDVPAARSDLQELRDAWMNEKAAPEILQCVILRRSFWACLRPETAIRLLTSLTLSPGSRASLCLGCLS